MPCYHASMTKNTNNHLQVELHVPDFNIVLDFYGKLGFRTVWQRSNGDSGDYLVMERAGTILSFWPGNDQVFNQSYFNRFPKDTKRGFGVEIVITVEDVQKLHDEIKSFAKIVNPLVKRAWGLWDFRIEDPFGYYLRITEPHDITDNTYAIPDDFKD